VASVQGIENLCNLSFVKKVRECKYVVEKLIPVEEWDDLVEQIRKKHNKAPVIIIDYLRKLRTKSKTSDERLRVDDIISKLTDLAKKNNIPVLAISELARDSYKSGQRLSMASFKESGTIEYEASWLGILAAVEEVNGEYQIKENWEKIIDHDGNIDLIVFKAKRGTGATGRIPLKLNKSKMTVTERENSDSSIRPDPKGKKSRFERKE
jgi:replicative DNA helicase